MKKTQNAQTLTIRHSNEVTASFNTGRTVDTSKRQLLKSGGRFVERNYQLEYSGNEQFFMRYLEVDIEEGN